MTAILILFTSAFASATLLPGSSEAVLAGAMKLSDEPLWLLLAVATVGNTLGAAVNWVLGLLVAMGRERVKLPVSAERLDRFDAFYRRYGVWGLLLSWVPIIGDTLTVLAGLARTPLLVFLPLVAVGKLARYLVVAELIHAVN
jgi:membrane protein YqaA with SNARE-associated domain